MIRALHFLGNGISPFHKWKPHSCPSLTQIVSTTPKFRSNPFEFISPVVLSQSSGYFRAFQVFASRSESNPEGNSSSSSSSAASPLLAHMAKINFCQFCGGPTKQIILEGEEKPRAVCTLCGKTLYQNPKMVVGCLVEHNNKILLCKRKIQPSHGLWTLPAGYMEIGESAAEGAARETFEEANAEVEILSPFAMLDIPLIGQSYIIFRAKLKNAYFSPGPESMECELFALNEIPYDSLAFQSVLVTLRMYAEDLKAGKLKSHYCIINKSPKAGPSDLRNFHVNNHLHS